MCKILVVDDDNDSREQLEVIAQGENRQVFNASNEIDALNLIEQQDFDVIITDLRMGGNETAGIDVLKAAKKKSIHTQVILVTVYGTPDISVETMRFGAFDYLERNTPGTDILEMLKAKIKLAIEFQKATRGKEITS